MRRALLFVLLSVLPWPLKAADFSGTPSARASNQGSTLEHGINPVVESSAIDELALVAIPEPGVLLTLAGGIGTLLGLQRFRRRPAMRRRHD